MGSMSVIERIFRRRVSGFGLALGGGAVRGFAHIGVIRALEKAGIEPDYVAGTSAGSLVGALYCAGFSADRIEEEARKISWGDLVQLAFPKMGLVKSERLTTLVETLIGDLDIKDLRRPFAAVAVDVRKGKEVVLDSGPVGIAVRASCCVPGLFVPVEHDTGLLIDGGAMNSVPADVARSMGANFVVGIDLNADNVDTGDPVDSVIDVMVRTMGVLMYSTKEKGVRHSDIFVQPDLAGFSYHSMSQLDEEIRRGESAMEEVMPEIRRSLKAYA